MMLSKDTSHSDSQLFGTVVKSCDKGSLVGAEVLLTRLSNKEYFGVLSDMHGHFLIQIEPGQYMLQIKFLGYKSINENLVLQAGERIQITAELGHAYIPD